MPSNGRTEGKGYLETEAGISAGDSVESTTQDSTTRRMRSFPIYRSQLITLTSELYGSLGEPHAERDPGL